MAAKLDGTKSIKRLIRVYGVEGWVEVTLTSDGIKMRTPCTRKYLVASWAGVAEGAMTTPDDSPSYLMGEPVKFLQENARKAVMRRAKKLTA